MRRFTRRLVGTATISLLAATMTATLASPAAATDHKLTGIVYVDSTWPSDTTARKTATVDCPGTTYVVGTGFSAGDFGGNVRIEDVIPSPHSVTVWANVDEDGPITTSWSLTARAVCADQPPGWQIVRTTSSFSSDFKTGVAACLGGKVAIGAGFELPDTNGQLAMTSLRPTADRVNATAYEDDTGYSFNWSVTTYAVCSYALEGLEIVTKNIDDGVGGQTETAWCSASKSAIGAAGYFDGGDGNVFLTHLNSYRLPQFNNASGTTTQGNDDDDGTSLGYDMTGIALCVST